MLRDDFKFGVILRRAMARAGIVEGYLHVCRRQGCRHEERAADDGERRCPEHGYRLWPKPIRQITFHHLRHTAGSLFLMAGVPLEVVQRMLRHTDPKITSGVYGHLLLSYQREAIGRARLLPPELLARTAFPARASTGSARAGLWERVESRTASGGCGGELPSGTSPQGPMDSDSGNA
jgi:hypothetical protein